MASSYWHELNTSMDSSEASNENLESQSVPELVKELVFMSAGISGLNEAPERVSQIYDDTLAHIQKSKHFLATCSDALESESLTEMINKRDAILELRKK